MPKIKCAREYLEEWEIGKIISYLHRESDKVLFEFVYDTGARISEVLAVRPKDIDFNDGIVTLPALKRKELEFKLVTLSAPMLDRLRKFCNGKPKDKRLFPISRQQAYVRLKMASLDAGIEVYPHLLRDSFATNWAKKGGDLVRLQRQLGHKRLSTTTDRYLKYSTADIKDERERIGI